MRDYRARLGCQRLFIMNLNEKLRFSTLEKAIKNFIMKKAKTKSFLLNHFKFCQTNFRVLFSVFYCEDYRTSQKS